MSISDIFDIIVKQRAGEFNGIVATVNSVDSVNKICEVTDLRGGVITKVRLIAANTTGMYMIPAVGSVVIVHQISNQDYYISLFSQLSGVTMLDGSFGGLVEVVNLTTKLNNIENLLNNLIGLYNAHTHVANGTPTVSIEAGSLTTTVRANIENTLITHGI